MPVKIIFLFAIIVCGIIVAVGVKKNTHRVCLFTVAAALFTGMLLYYNYLLGNAYFLYAVIDGYSQYLPNYMNYAQTLLSGEGLNFWSFCIGFGNIRSYDVLLYLPNLFPILCGALWGEEALMVCFAWMHVLKIMLAALFAFLFMRKLGLNDIVCATAALLYAFNGILIIRGFWIFLADECYILMLILWSAEKYFKDRDGRWIPVSIFVLSSCLGMYYIYLYALLLFVYSFIRYIYAQKSLKGYMKFLFPCIGLFTIGVLTCCVTIIGINGSSLYETARFSSTVEGAVRGLPLITDSTVLLSGIMSFFNVDMLGYFDQYRGGLNYLERPLFYCGIGIMFFIIQGIAWGKHRKLMLFGMIVASVYLLSPTVLNILNAFIINEESGLQSYRLSSLWIMAVLIVSAAYGLQCSLEHGFHGICAILTGTVLSAILAITYLNSGYAGIAVETDSFIWTIMMISLWTMILVVCSIVIRKPINDIFVLLILCVALGEEFVADRTTINTSIVTANNYYTEMVANDTGYYSDMKEAVRYLQKTDDELYRVAGLRTDVGVATYCTPLYFNVYDSAYYTNIDSGTYEFLKEIYPESFMNDVGTKFSIGVGNNKELRLLTGYKYVLSTDEMNEDEGLLLFKTIGNINIYKIKNSISFGACFDHYMYLSDFKKYDHESQRKILLSCAIIDDDFAANGIQVTKKYITELFNQKEKLYERQSKLLQDCALQVTSWKANDIQGTITMESDGILMLSIPHVSGWTLYVDGTQKEIAPVDIGFSGINLDAGKHDVRMLYVPPLLPFGAMLTTAGLLAYVILLYRWSHRKKGVTCNEAG